MQGLGAERLGVTVWGGGGGQLVLTVTSAPRQALRDVPEVNSAWMGDFIRQYDSVNVSVAVQTPHGLMVPVLRDTDAMGLSDINTAVKSLAGRVRRALDADPPSH